MLTKRLDRLVSLILPCDTLADVGCDHGYLGIEALHRRLARQVIFVDISEPSLQKARQNCPKDFTAQTTFICQDGLQNIDADCAIIAGMGGLEILSILGKASVLPKQLVLQPMRNQRDVREYLSKNGYEIVADKKFFDGKFYDSILAVFNGQEYCLTELELEFGWTNLRHPSADFEKFLQLEYDKLTQILQGCNDETVVHRLEIVKQAFVTIGLQYS